MEKKPYTFINNHLETTHAIKVEQMPLLGNHIILLFDELSFALKNLTILSTCDIEQEEPTMGIPVLRKKISKRKENNKTYILFIPYQVAGSNN